MYFVGLDVGSTKTHALIINQDGDVLGFGIGGPGNYENVGYERFFDAVRIATSDAAASAGIGIDELNGAGFGISGYDWLSEKPMINHILSELRLPCPLEIVNDSCLGLIAGTSEGWGVAVVSGTGCNCWGWTKDRERIAHVTGYGNMMGEGAGSTELVAKAIQRVAYEWTSRGPATAITTAFIELTGAKDLPDLVEGLCRGKFDIPASAAPLIFEIANKGDKVAIDILRWAGEELGELARAVISQLELQSSDVEVVQVGSMFDGGDLLILPMQHRIWDLAPNARLIRLDTFPVVGACLLGMEKAGLAPSVLAKARLNSQISKFDLKALSKDSL